MTPAFGRLTARRVAPMISTSLEAWIGNANHSVESCRYLLRPGAGPLLAQQDRITSAIDNKRVVVLDSRVRPLALAEHGDEGLVEPPLGFPG